MHKTGVGGARAGAIALAAALIIPASRLLAVPASAAEHAVRGATAGDGSLQQDQRARR